MERDYVFWHSGRAFLAAIAALAVAGVGAAGILTIGNASPLSVAGACAFAVALVPVPWVLDRRLRRRIRTQTAGE